MSNNKQSIKLYTEEQVLEAIDRSIFSKPNINSFDILEDLTPIQLPSDQEIENLIGDGMQNYYKGGFEEGAKWMRNKIQGGNK